VNIETMARRVRGWKQIDDDNATIQRMIDNAGVISSSQRVPHRIAKRLLLQDKFFSHGKFMQFTAKSVGCAIYEVKAEIIA